MKPLLGVVGICTFLALTCDAVGQDNLSNEDIAFLESLDNAMIDECLALVAKAQGWRDRLSAIQATASGDPQQVEQLKQLLNELDAELGRVPPAIKARMRDVRGALTHLDEAERAWRDLPYRAEDAEGLDEAAFREKIRDEVMGQAANEAIEQVKAEVLTAIEGLRHPVQFTQDFVQGELTAWLSTSRTVGDLTFRIVEVQTSVSPFSPEASMAIELTYAEGITVQAKGLRFTVENNAPKAVLDPAKLAVDEGQLRSMFVGQALKALGEVLPSDLGLGINVSDVAFLGFAPGGPKNKPGGLKFDLKVSLGNDIVPELKGEEFVLYPDGDFAAGTLGVQITDVTGKPIGTTGLGYYGFSLNYTHTTQVLEGRTNVSTFPGSADACRLNVGLTLPLATSPTRMTLDGTFEMAQGGLTLADVNAYLDFANGEIGGGFAFPSKSGQAGDALALLYSVDGEFKLNREGLFANGNMVILGQSAADMRLDIRFDGNATLMANAGFDILGVNASASLFAQLEPGLREGVFEAVVNVEVPVEPWGDISCTVRVTADTSRFPAILVETNVLGQEIAFPWPSGLDTLTIGALAKEIGSHVSSMYHNVLAEIARGEKATRDWGAEVDSKTRNYIHERAKAAGIDKISTGNDDVDAFLGKISEGGKSAGGAWHDFTQSVGGGASGIREGVLTGISNLGDTASDAGEWISNVFGGSL